MGKACSLQSRNINFYKYPTNTTIPLSTYLSTIKSNSISFSIGAFAKPISISSKYRGAIYWPTLDRILFLADPSTSSGTIIYPTVPALDISSVGVGNCWGAVYSPLQDIIFCVPNSVSPSTALSCLLVSSPPYSIAISCVANAYAGGVYSPTQNRIYFVPHGQSNQTNWHYIDCNVEDVFTSVVVYTHAGITLLANAYQGGVYSPTQNRIYFVPYSQSNQTDWHYIDCDTGVVTAYQHAGITLLTSAYAGGVYSPLQNRIYLVPYSQSNKSTWHYIDCDTGTVVAYTHGVSAVTNGYSGGVYSPKLNAIFLVPYGQSNQTNWHYIDCNTGNVVAYQPGVTVAANAYSGGVYFPTQGRIYFSPNILVGSGTNATWYFIQENVDPNASPDLMACHLFNKF